MHGHRAFNWLPRICIVALLIVTVPRCARAVTCNSFTDAASCDGTFTDAGKCAWDSTKGVCVTTGEQLPPGMVGITAIPEPATLSPGPSSSTGDDQSRSQLPTNDTFCIQPAETGPCRGYFPSYHYNTTSGACDQFTYGGCDGNLNRFQTLQACEDAAISFCNATAEQFKSAATKASSVIVPVLVIMTMALVGSKLS